MTRHDVRGNLAPDAALVALAVERGVTLCSVDTGFARSRDPGWHDPLG